MSDPPETKLGVPPTITIPQHINNLCVIASGLIITPSSPIGTIGEDALVVYHKVIDAYVLDSTMPQSTQT